MVYLFGEALNIYVDEAFSNIGINVALYLAGERAASNAVIDHTFETLRRDIEQAPGVSFSARQ